MESMLVCVNDGVYARVRLWNLLLGSVFGTASQRLRADERGRPSDLRYRALVNNRRAGPPTGLTEGVQGLLKIF